MAVLCLSRSLVQYSLKELPSLQTAYDWCSVNVVEDSFVCRTFSTEATIDDIASGEGAGPFQVATPGSLSFKEHKGTQTKHPFIRLLHPIYFEFLMLVLLPCSQDHHRPRVLRSHCRSITAGETTAVGVLVTQAKC